MGNQIESLQMGKKFKKTPAGEIPVDWECCSIFDVTEVFGGGTPDRANPKYWDGGIFWATPTDVTAVTGATLSCTKGTISDAGLKNSSANLLPPGSVLMTSRATLGYAVVNTAPMATNQGFINFKCSERLHNYFLMYYLRLKAVELERLAAGSTFLEIPKSALRSFSVPIPTLEEQQRIADILSSAENLYENILDEIKKTKKLKKSLMRLLLTRGLGHGEFKKTLIGTLPSEWGVVPLEQVCEKIQDGTHFSPKSKSGPYLYITSKNIRMGYIDLSNVSGISEEEHREIYKRSDVRKGDVLLTKDGANAGNIAVNTIETEVSLLSSVAMIRPDLKVTCSEWIYQFYASEKGNKLVLEQVAGQAITRLTLEKIRNLTFVLPSIKEQKEICEILSAVDQEIEKNNNTLKKVSELKMGLMKMLLTGKVRVS